MRKWIANCLVKLLSYSDIVIDVHDFINNRNTVLLHKGDNVIVFLPDNTPDDCMDEMSAFMIKQLGADNFLLVRTTNGAPITTARLI